MPRARRLPAFSPRDWAAASSPGAVPSEVPEAHATARITPWQAQPLPEAYARVRALDVGAIWAQAPQTHLTGELHVRPIEGASPGATGWVVDADLTNRGAGPWDQHRLPVERLLADLIWQHGVATVRSLKADVAGGTLESTGRWAQAPALW